MHITRRRPDSVPGAAGNFTGTVWLDEVAAPAAPSRLRMFSVHFAPGARTAWRRHPHGQVLHVPQGEGLVRRRGGATETIRAGDTVWIEPDEWHWHGAGPRTFMTHLAVVEAAQAGTTTEWGAHVCAEDTTPPDRPRPAPPPAEGLPTCTPCSTS
ncbi:cupin domain-containing protein [Streptomyces sp. NPDC058964]|uniref:(R)-mandelonitrile lyase n=1 Tax=Streptomyces sp. NPDC058964 TaxID=3346681 RepID=UPI00369179D0